MEIILPVEMEMASAILGWLRNRLRTLVAIGVGGVLVFLVVFLVWRAYKSAPGQEQAAYIQAMASVVLIVVTCWYVWLTQSVLKHERRVREEDARSKGRAFLAEKSVFGVTERFGDKMKVEEFRARPKQFANEFNFFFLHVTDMDRIRSCVKRDLAQRLIKLQHDGVLFDSGRHKAFFKTDEHGRDEPSEEYNHDEWVSKMESLVGEFRKLHDDLDDYYIVQSEDLG